MKLWCVSMECAGIAEAGGVKNVAFSLCKEFSLLGHDVTLFIPVFKCNSWNLLKNVKENFLSAQVELCDQIETVSYTKAICKDGNFKAILINHPAFAEKEAVYTYTENEQNQNPKFVKGQGHLDFLFMDTLFQKSIYAYFLNSKNENPDIIHCQDASTAVLPAFFKNEKNNKSKNPKFVVTIHNAGPFYHHEFANLREAQFYTSLPRELLENSTNRERVEPFLIAYNSGATLSTVSEIYAEELTDPKFEKETDGLSPIFFEKNVKIQGVTNGFDYDRYNPEDKNRSKLPFEFSPSKKNLAGKYKCRNFFLEKVANSDDLDFTGIKKYGKIKNADGIFIAYHGRITSQKGISVLNEAIPAIMQTFPDVNFVIAGQGETALEQNIVELTKKYDGRISFMNGYNQKIVRLVVASCDFIALPSFFEPCGLEDFIAQAFGTLPIAHKTGGLNKILDGKTGFLYEENSPNLLTAKIVQAIMIKKLKPSVVLNMIKKASDYIYKEYLWKNVIEKKYLKIFERILKN